MNTAKGEYEKSKSGTAAAKTAYDAAKDALGGIDIESLKQNLDAAKSKAATARQLSIRQTPRLLTARRRQPMPLLTRRRLAAPATPPR